MLRGLTGTATRRALADYLKMVALIMFVLLMIAWAIDLADHFDSMRTDAAARGVPVATILAPYLMYRTADMVTRMLPMACFFGVFLAEVGRRLRLETVVLQAGGASPLRLLAGILLFAVLTGTLQSRLENDWRPAAVAAQVKLGHGTYAERYDLDWTHDYHWFVADDIAVRAQVRRGAPSALRNVLVFKGIKSPRLEAIISAEQLIPGQDQNQWVAINGTRSLANGNEQDSTDFDRFSLTLDLIPEQVKYFEVSGWYIPDPDLRKIASQTKAATAPGADLAIWQRLTAWTLPGTFALLAFCLANSGFSGRRPDIPRLIALACLGYVSVVSVKVFWSMGELSVLPAPIAVLASVSLVWILSIWLLWRQS